MKIDKSAVINLIKGKMHHFTTTANMHNLIANIETLPTTVDEWVSVEKIGRCHASVLVRTLVNYIGTANYDFENNVWNIHGIGPSDNVTHFMYLPAPPTNNA